ncbi:MAG: two-component system, OmpR family, response regulator MtrA [Elusimicrobia bacterium]|nr:MAG: two-component system, OmpR family, response regulator MtrA [Elusimicrobiota bacterium]
MIVAIVGIDTKLCLQYQNLLQAQGHHVTLLADPTKASARLESLGAHLVVLAGMGVKETCVALLRGLRANGKTRALPILQVDPSGSMKDIVEFLDAGADDFLAKPFNDEIFLARVRTLLRRSLWSGHLPADPVVSLVAGPVRLSLPRVRAVGLPP